MNQFAYTAGKSVADLAQGVGVSQLAEQHGHQLCPATEALGSSFCIMFLHQGRELKPREVLEQLIEQAHRLYHCFALLSGIPRPNSPPKDGSPLEQL
jgi:hypothetical protein